MSGSPPWDPFCLLTKEPTVHQRHHAVRTVAAHAQSAEDLAELLDMLGLAASDRREPPVEPEERAESVRSGPSPEILAQLTELRRQLTDRQ